MSLISFSARFLSGFYRRKISNMRTGAAELQYKQLNRLLLKGKDTFFGNQHLFKKISGYDSFRKSVPVRNYESFREYIYRIQKGEADILWPGRPDYFAKTSGTTSGAKYIPVTSDSMPNQVESARFSLFNYLDITGNYKFLEGKYLYLSGSPELDYEYSIPSGRLSGIANHHVPSYLKRNQLPSTEVNCIEDWDKKVERIVTETIGMDVSLISGIPPWVQNYFERALSRSGYQSVRDLFPNLSLFLYGGVNFDPYRSKFEKILDDRIDYLEIFPASEGFFAFQDQFPSKGMLLIPDGGIFYEFIPLDKYRNSDPERVPLEGVSTGVNYVMIISTNAGLWGYNIGDTVRFVSRDPYRLVVTGRISHFTSAFGEHVISEEVESSIREVSRLCDARITEFTVAPLLDNPSGLPCHEWFIEFSKMPDSIDVFSDELDKAMQARNSYYRDLVRGNIMQPLIIRVMPENSFSGYMRSKGKLGGQNKVPHLMNDRTMADILINF